MVKQLAAGENQDTSAPCGVLACITLTAAVREAGQAVMLASLACLLILSTGVAKASRKRLMAVQQLQDKSDQLYYLQVGLPGATPLLTS